MKRRETKRLRTLPVMLVACLVAVGCGGGGGTDLAGGIIDPGVTATFVGDDMGDIGMTMGATAGSEFNIEIHVDDEIDKFFGAAFEVKYDNTSASFLGVSGAGSFLGTASTFQGAPVALNKIAVVASLIGRNAGIDDASGLLITLRFKAIAATAENRFDFSPVLEVTTCPSATTCIQAPPMTWTGGKMVAM